mgnify:CR=1 FL=1
MSPRPAHPLLILLALSVAACAPFAPVAAPVTQPDTEAHQDLWWKRWAQ